MLIGFSERKLIEKAAQGDDRSFGILRRRYEKLVTKICKRFFYPDEDEIEDAVQDTFVKVSTQLSQFRSEARFDTWLHRVTRNVCIDRYNRNKKTVASIPDTIFEDDQGMMGTVPSAEEEYLSQHARDPILDAVQDALDPRDYQIFVFTYQEEMRSEEVAFQLGMTAVNVRKRLNTRIKPALQQIVRK